MNLIEIFKAYSPLVLSLMAIWYILSIYFNVMIKVKTWYIGSISSEDLQIATRVPILFESKSKALEWAKERAKHGENNNCHSIYQEEDSLEKGNIFRCHIFAGSEKDISYTIDIYEVKLSKKSDMKKFM